MHNAFVCPDSPILGLWLPGTDGRQFLLDRVHDLLPDRIEIGVCVLREERPHCPEENGLMERTNRTIAEALEGEELTDYLQAVKVIARLIRWYYEQRLHSALGFLRPVDYYRGKPEELYAERRQKLVAARHRRRERNLHLRQPMLQLTSEKSVA
ncbi:MAG: integrase core domain-containing protein [Thermoguttaceae bacterium]